MYGTGHGGPKTLLGTSISFVKKHTSFYYTNTKYKYFRVPWVPPFTLPPVIEKNMDATLGSISSQF